MNILKRAIRLMKINDNTFFDYIDGIMSKDEIIEFEQYLQDNPNAKKSLMKLRKWISAQNIVVNDDIIQDIPQELLKSKWTWKKIVIMKNKKTKDLLR